MDSVVLMASVWRDKSVKEHVYTAGGKGGKPNKLKGEGPCTGEGAWP